MKLNLSVCVGGVCTAFRELASYPCCEVITSAVGLVPVADSCELGHTVGY